ncbi:hypothetical protein PR202_gb13449 [Eleusine coracana subsp. coracana]|uniref:RING-type E3 ubiquitin transferase n=1 Tax=Eleusine coracana subsp. coracana TaxID=191504 RepID=A0AAV5ESW4_ELECO|nr:hypothetical protein PR202_gb13449 [Eleusine coracana subsp. coracana]
MGAFCSCLQVDYSDHHGNNASSAFRNCVCLRCFTQQLINALISPTTVKYTVLFRVGAVHPVSQAIEATPVDSSESSFDTYRSPPRPLPYDDPRFSPPSRDWFALRRAASSHSPDESEPLRADDDEEEEMETPVPVDKSNYTSENPRIVMQCSHHFHLGCIYEWMERSEACPVCGKKMEFDETT